MKLCKFITINHLFVLRSKLCHESIISSAGPSMLPLPVLERAAAEMTDYHGSGMSVAEMGHRSPIYESIIHEAEATLRRVYRFRIIIRSYSCRAALHFNLRPFR